MFLFSKNEKRGLTVKLKILPSVLPYLKNRFFEDYYIFITFYCSVVLARLGALWRAKPGAHKAKGGRSELASLARHLSLSLFYKSMF